VTGIILWTTMVGSEIIVAWRKQTYLACPTNRSTKIGIDRASGAGTGPLQDVQLVGQLKQKG